MRKLKKQLKTFGRGDEDMENSAVAKKMKNLAVAQTISVPYSLREEIEERIQITGETVSKFFAEAAREKLDREREEKGGEEK